MRRVLAVFAVVLAFAPARADALTVRDIIELTRAGLGEDVLLALIEVDRSVFPIDTATLKSLKEWGVSERVILAMVRSARTPPPIPEPTIVADPAPAPPPPQVIVIEHHDPPQIREVPVAYPVYIPVAIRRSRVADIRSHDRVDQPSLDHSLSGLSAMHPTSLHPTAVNPTRERAPEPVYWGTSGKLRPDAWNPR